MNFPLSTATCSNFALPTSTSSNLLPCDLAKHILFQYSTIKMITMTFIPTSGQKLFRIPRNTIKFQLTFEVPSKCNAVAPPSASNMGVLELESTAR